MERKISESADIEERRRYNREFMRRWRADPFNQAMERKKRRDWYYERQKQRQPRERSKRCRALDQKKGVCGLCWRRPAVTTIVRLQICEGASQQYAQVRIPYCGEC
jgi:hypothetical protein